MRKLYDRYQLPMIVTENGMALSESLDEENRVHDAVRIEYLSRHLGEVEELIREGYPVFGYCVWSLMIYAQVIRGSLSATAFCMSIRTETDAKQCARFRKDSFFLVSGR